MKVFHAKPPAQNENENENGEVSKSDDKVMLIVTRYLVQLLHWHSHPRADNASGAGPSALKAG